VKKPKTNGQPVGPAFVAQTVPQWKAMSAALGSLPQLTPFTDYSAEMTAAINMRAHLDAYIAEMHACNGYSAVMRRLGMGPPR